MKASGMDVLSMDVYPRCFYSRRVYNEVSILQVRLWMLSIDISPFQKEMERFEKFQNRFLF